MLTGPPPKFHGTRDILVSRSHRLIGGGIALQRHLNHLERTVDIGDDAAPYGGESAKAGLNPVRWGLLHGEVTSEQLCLPEGITGKDVDRAQASSGGVPRRCRGRRPHGRS